MGVCCGIVSSRSAKSYTYEVSLVYLLKHDLNNRCANTVREFQEPSTLHKEVQTTKEW